ncbi:sugar phosphate isomerase/epimerase family protein [Cohnella phaseoli]|uniref:Hexulose-6-phosphate isomerase n=1 Tax=Cohnella phaseoli TaxID=456490 RepID=A0A3D9IRK9_9BACL|nr:sugar phosphate isomerase/epimerase family protein [Cohnella phaseoli]RED64441.1 hexulose-6-phosphate isomerase [Cohnella phaseoli]
MKKGINAWSFPAGMGAKECIRLAKSAGFDGIELELAETGELSLAGGEKEALELKAYAKETGIELSSLASGLYWDYPLTSNDEAIRRKGLDVAKKQLEMAAAIGVDTILLIPGAVGVDFIPGAEVVPYDVAYDRAQEAVSQLASIAAEHQVNIGLENVWNKFLLSPLEMRNFIDEIGSPWVGSYFDVGNTLANGYPEHWISILGKRIKKVHFKDYRRQAGGLHGFVDLLAGDVDYPAVVKALEAVGYDDYVIAEMIPAYTHHSEQIIYNTSRSMDRILGREAAR